MYKEKDFRHLLGTEGFSDILLENHFKLYAGYVRNVNTLIEKISTLESTTPEFGELSRRFGWEWNGMRLHELYFGNMSREQKNLSADSPLLSKMIESFGSGEVCHDRFVSTGLLRGVGWVVMYYDTVADRLFHVWIEEHGENHLSGCTPIVVMDMWEHAFMVDYGLAKKDYIDAFVNAIDWREAERRYEMAKRQNSV
jgi:superoxide dismutase, Fe-Mn family